MNGDSVVVTRAIYECKLFEKVTCSGTPQFITMRGRAFPKPNHEAGKSGTITKVEAKTDAISTVEGYSVAAVGPNAMSDDSFSTRWNSHLLAAPGYYLIMTNYTGSTGFGEKFADDIERDVLRGPAIETLEAITEAAKKYPQMDTTRQCAAGGSSGGYLMNWYNGTTNQFKCLVNHAGAVNNESQYGLNDGGLTRELRMGAPIWETGKGRWFDQSPIRYAKNWKTPMLVTQGELDFRVPVSEAMTTFKLLQRLRVPARFVIFPDEGLWILKGPNSRKHMEEVMGWFKRYLEPAS